MKRLIALPILLLVLACVSSCKPAIDTSKDRVPAWAIGGTLHDMRLPYWAHGAPEDKLATAGEVLYQELWRGHLESDEQISAFRRQSEKLVRMMDDMSGLYPRLLQVNPSVAGWTARSLIQESVRNGSGDLNKLMGPASMDEALGASPVDDGGRPINADFRAWGSPLIFVLF